MAGGQERVLRRRIRSVASTQKITRAMELIAASRIVRAQQAIAAARPYVSKMREVVEHLADTPDAATHPLFREVEAVQRVAIVLVTADRGLAGGYNVQIIRTVERMVREHRAAGREVQLVPFGKKGDNHFRRRNFPIITSITGVSERPTYADARRAVTAVMQPFEAGELDQIELVYTRFVSLGSQVATVRQLVPLVRSDVETVATADHREVPGHKTDYEFEPEPGEILDRLLPSWLVAEVLAALLESAASEQASRQRAMKAATDNADELIKNLRRVMNRARQDSITTEIMEIVGGAEALRQSRSDPGGSAAHDIFETAAESA
ncbi:MAG TPA: F0F1 ATP synthase subunit gamma [Acidimicrobiales bacterium]